MRALAGAARLAALGSLLLSQIAAAAVTARRADDARPARVVEGRVARLEPATSPDRYPRTQVTLEPSGERFTILGGYRDGLLWVAAEETRFALGDRVRVSLEETAVGTRVLDAERLEGAAAVTGGVAPRVLAVSPSSGPAAELDVELEITGTGFGNLGLGSVFFAGLFTHVQATVLEWTDTRIRVLVPRPGIWNDPQVLSGPVKVWTAMGGWSDGDEFSGGAEYRVLFQYAGDHFPDARLPIGYSINPEYWPWSLGEVEAMLARALRPWNEIESGYARFAPRGITEGRSGPRRDGVNTVAWVTPWPHPDSWLAVTWSGIDSLTGERRESDIEINGHQPWSIEDTTPIDSYDLQTTMTHEFGHWLRLGHVQELQHVMLPFQIIGEQRRTLGEGDREGASWIYPTLGTAAMSADSAYFGGADRDTLVLDVRLLDRRGRPLAGIPADRIGARLEWIDAPAGWLGPARAVPGAASVLVPESGTDAEGRTRFVVRQASGSGRVRFSVFGPAGELRERPVVYVSDGDRAQPRTPLSLTAPWPNPLRGGTLRVSARLGSPVARLVARVYDARGRVIASLWDGPAAGDVLLTWSNASGRPPAPGLYFLRVDAGAHSETRKLVVVAP